MQLAATILPAVSLVLLSSGSVAGHPSLAASLAVCWIAGTSFHGAGAMGLLHSVGGPRAAELFVIGNVFSKLGALVSSHLMTWAIRVWGWAAVLTALAGMYAASSALLLPQINQTRLTAAAAVIAGVSESEVPAPPKRM